MSLGLNANPSSACHVLGVRFDRFGMAQAVEQILHWTSEQSHRLVITAGPEFVMMTRTHPDVRAIAQAADLVVPDGVGVLWAAQRQHTPFQERIAGVELAHEVLTIAAQRGMGLRVYIFGAAQDVVEECLQHFRAQFPNLELSGRSGYFSEDEVPDIMADIEQFAPHLWLVGLGQPRQERLIYQWLGRLPPCVAIGVGGSIDVWSGRVKRAPNVFRQLNLEWLYRLLSQPSRWRRQTSLPRFAWQVLRGAGHKR